MMVQVVDKDIVPELYHKYYSHDNTPTEMVSSHWKALHQKAKVNISDHHPISLQGMGFGDLQHKSLSYRIFSRLTIRSYLILLNKRAPSADILRSAHKVCERMDVPMTYDCFRQACSLSLIKNKLIPHEPIKVLCIGDGYGFMSSLIKDIFPKARIFCVDLGKTLLFQAHFCRMVHPQAGHSLVTQHNADFHRKADFIYCPAEYLESLAGENFNLAINIASMQEMNSAIIAQYFKFLRQNLTAKSLFYCCNRLEKKMSDTEIARFHDYPWSPEDVHIIDEYCPWYRFFLAGHRSRVGPAVWGMRIPFVNYFDGPIWHRLTVLKTNSKESAPCIGSLNSDKI